MNTIMVWLLVLTGPVNGGRWVAVQPQMFPTLEWCEQVGRNSFTHSNTAANYRCVQTTIVR